MFSLEFISEISNKSGIRQRELIEEDLVLHKLLIELYKDEKFKEKYAFKGGTCLTKCYLGYYRFSEDLDFTFVGEIENKSEKTRRKKISSELDEVISLVEGFCLENKLDFKPEKNNSKYFEFGGGNKFTTIKIYYDSIFKKNNMIKLQFNFLEDIRFKIKKLRAVSVLNQVKMEWILYPEYVGLKEKPFLRCYDLKEILCEKIRAILTRKGVKSRDFIDVYMITKKVKVELLKREIIDKTIFMFKYGKYFENFERHFNDIPRFKSSEEEYLVVSPLGKDFSSFLSSFEIFLKNILDKIKNENNKCCRGQA